MTTVSNGMQFIPILATKKKLQNQSATLAGFFRCFCGDFGWFIDFFSYSFFFFWRVVSSLDSTNRSFAACLAFLCHIFSQFKKSVFHRLSIVIVIHPSQKNKLARDYLSLFLNSFSLNPNVDPWFNRLSTSILQPNFFANLAETYRPNPVPFVSRVL